jgi:hypothetical protein
VPKSANSTDVGAISIAGPLFLSEFGEDELVEGIGIPGLSRIDSRSSWIT